MPQLNPAPWLFVLTFVWITLLAITLKVIRLRLPRPKPDLGMSISRVPLMRNPWQWPWH